jgi:hypothetical protein
MSFEPSPFRDWGGSLQQQRRYERIDARNGVT